MQPSDDPPDDNTLKENGKDAKPSDIPVDDDSSGDNDSPTGHSPDENDTPDNEPSSGLPPSELNRNIPELLNQYPGSYINIQNMIVPLLSVVKV